MAAAQKARHRVTYITEVTPNTTPATPDMVELPVTSFTLTPNRDEIESDFITSDRQRRPSSSGLTKRAGDLGFQLVPGTFDDLFASAMNGAWTTNVLKSGNTGKTFTMESGHPDINNAFWIFRGVLVNSFSLNVPLDGKVAGTFNLLAQSHEATATSIDATVPAANPGIGLTHFTGSASIGGVTAAVLTSLTLNYTNQAVEDFVLFSREAESVDLGEIQVGGSLTSKILDLSLFNNFDSAVLGELEFTIANEDNSMSYTFTLPKTKFTSYTRDPAGKTGSAIQTLNFSSFHDDTSGSDLIITRDIS